SRALWASNLYDDSALVGNSISLLGSSDGRAFGVRERSEPRRAEHAGAPAGRQSAKISTGNTGLVAPTLEQVLAVASCFTAECHQEELKAKLEALYQKPRK
ncbi:MAG: hypothetical protein QME12_05720, partial [Nanoarchaeota archaeon]|nr:hypothetical protein [Nanoarchaeota archaeon]